MNQQERFLPACLLCASSYSAGSSNQQTNASWHGITKSERNVLSHPGPPPPPLAQALQGPTVRGCNSWGSPLQPATICAGSHQNAAAHEQPSGAIRWKESLSLTLSQSTWGRRELVVSLLKHVRHDDVFVEFLVGNLVELHVPTICRITVGCQTTKNEKMSTKALPAAYQGEEIE